METDRSQPAGRDLLGAYARLAAEHRDWLDRFGREHRSKWDRMLCRSPQAALFEAVVRRYLVVAGLGPRPGEQHSGGGPDFICEQGSLAVEAKCLTIDKVARATGLPDLPMEHGGSYAFPTSAIRKAVTEKAAQAPVGVPYVVAIGTFHFMGAWMVFDRRGAEFVLAGKPVIVWPVTPDGDCAGAMSEKIDPAPASFYVHDGCLDGTLDAINRDVGGVLLLGLGAVEQELEPSRLARDVHLVLNPGAAIPVDPTPFRRSSQILGLRGNWRSGMIAVEPLAPEAPLRSCGGDSGDEADETANRRA